MRSAGTNARRLAGAGRGVDQGMKISEAMRPDDVFVGISVASKPRLLDFLAEKAAEVCGVARDDIWQALRAREELDRAHTERTAPAVKPTSSASPIRLSSKART